MTDAELEQLIAFGERALRCMVVGWRVDVGSAEEAWAEVLCQGVEAVASGRVVDNVEAFALSRCRAFLLAERRVRFSAFRGEARRSVVFVDDWGLVGPWCGRRSGSCVVVDWACEGVALAFDEARHLAPVQRAVFEVAVRIAAEGRFEHPRKRGESLYTRIARDASEFLGRVITVESAGKSLQVVQRRMRRCLRVFVESVEETVEEVVSDG